MGYILFLAGDTEAGTEALREAIKLGGEEIRQRVLANAEINSLPVDDAFKELVRTIPAAS